MLKLRVIYIYLKLPFPKETSNPMNMVQGGMITAALDDATAMVIISAYEFKFRTAHN